MSMEPKELLYRKTLATIAKQLSDEDMRSIRFICKAVEGLSKRDRELTDPLAFFVKLEERGVLAWNDTDFLAELLQLVGRRDCLALLEAYQRGGAASGGNELCKEPVQTSSLGGEQPAPLATDSVCTGGVRSSSPYAAVANGTSGWPRTTGPKTQVTGSSYHEDLREAFELTADEVGRNWRQLARKLGLREAELDWVSADHPLNLREQCMQSLLLWQRKAPAQATKGALIQALRKCQMMYIADRLDGYQFR